MTYKHALFIFGTIFCAVAIMCDRVEEKMAARLQLAREYRAMQVMQVMP